MTEHLMGIFPFSKSCNTNYAPEAPAPNPDPKRWKILSHRVFNGAYVLTVRHLDATNFEGVKVMVYEGEFPGLDGLSSLDPHFAESGVSPIARFRPTKDGIALACAFAQALSLLTRPP